MDEILNNLASDFTDLTDIAEAVRMLVRLLLAAMLGGILGYDRERVGKAAGLRTHMLVSLGSAMFVLIPLQAGMSENELSRIIQGVAAGIGFLGAGAIVKGKNEADTQGLTTAAGIWLTAAIGISAGLGREASAILGTILAFIILSAFGALSHWFKEDQTQADQAQTNTDAKLQTPPMESARRE